MTTEVDEVKKIDEFYKIASDDNANWRSRAQANWRFYEGVQWDDADRRKLEAEGKPALTFNRILPVINFLSGLQRQNRHDTSFYPKRGGTYTDAQVMTELHKHIMDISNGEWEFSLAFLGGLVLGKSWLAMDLDYQYDPLKGDIVVENLSGYDIVEDRRNEKYDLNRSAEFMIRKQWVNPKRLALEYPNKIKDIEGGGLDLPPDSTDVIEELTEDPNDDYYRDKPGLDDPDKGIYRRRKKFLLKWGWYKQDKRRLYLVNSQTLEVVIVKPERDQLARALVQQSGGIWQIVERIVPVMHLTKKVGNIVLETIEDPFNGLCIFPYTRFCPYFFYGDIFGVIENLIDPQKDHNKRRSQILHIINTSVNSGFIVKGIKAAYRRILETFGSKPGMILEEDKCGGKIEPIQANNFPEGHFTMAAQDANDIKDISGVDANLMGHMPQDKEESGRSRYLRQQQGMTVNETVFDNFRLTRQIFGGLIGETIRRTDYFSPAEIHAIINESNQNIDLNQLHNLAVGRYGVKVAASSNHPTMRMMYYEQLMEARREGVMIPDDVIIEASDLPDKQRIIASIRQQQQIAMQNEAAERAMQGRNRGAA